MSDIEQIRQRIAEGERRVATQEERVREAERSGRSADAPLRLLQILKTALEAHRRHLGFIINQGKGDSWSEKSRKS